MKIQRYLTPTAAPLSGRDLLRGCLGLFHGRAVRATREAEFARYFGVKYAFALSSGKAALTTILQACAAVSPRRKVIIPAYTCFSVPSAVVRAGCEVVPCDVDPETLDYRFSDLQALVNDEVLCVVSPHLLGQAADITRVKEIARPYGIPVVEDAAQAMGGTQEGRRLGTQADVGFFSLGRGKNVTAGSGGIILTNADWLGDALAKRCQEIPEAPWGSRVRACIEAVVTALLIHPLLYWLPAGLPGLGLGDTKFEPDFPLHRLDSMRASLLAGWQSRLECSNAERLHRSQDLLDVAQGRIGMLGPDRRRATVYLRVPVILPTAEMKVRACHLSAEMGLGVSGLYPSPVSDIPAVRMSCGNRRFPGAQVLAERLVTCPVHHYVTHQDIVLVIGALRRVIDEAAGSSRQASVSTTGAAPAVKMEA